MAETKADIRRRLQKAKAVARDPASGPGQKQAAEAAVKRLEARLDTKAASATPKAPTAKRQAAVDAYTKKFGRAPTKSMSIKAMNAKVERANYMDTVRGPQRRQQVDQWLNGSHRAPSTHSGQQPGGGTTNDSHMGQASSPSRPPHRTPYQDAIHRARAAQPSPYRAGPDYHGGIFGRTHQAGFSRFVPSLGQVNTGLAVAGVGVSAARGYNAARKEGKSRGEAAIEGAKSAAIPAAMTVGRPVGSALSKGGDVALKVAGALVESSGLTDFMLGWPIMKLGGAFAVSGVAMKVAGAGLKLAGRVAAPAMAAYGAYQGAKEDSNRVRGAARGALRSLDPSGIFMERGLAERGFDAAFGRAKPTASAFAPSSAPKRLTSADKAAFKAANASFSRNNNHSMMGHDDGSGVFDGGRGFANPVVQAAAQKARGAEYEGPRA